MGLIENLTNIKSQITSLITYANTTTGESDTTIGDAVDSLIAGYGGGDMATGEYIPTSADSWWLGGLKINHGLPTKPKYALIIDTDAVVGEDYKVKIVGAFGFYFSDYCVGGALVVNADGKLGWNTYTNEQSMQYGGIKITDTQLICSAYVGNTESIGHKYRWYAW